MTPKEWAEGYIDKDASKVDEASLVAALIRDAVAEEREACARLIEEQLGLWHGEYDQDNRPCCKNEMSARIRARGGKQ